MALAETLSIDKLEALYEDDWHNVFKPMTIADTNLLGSVSSPELANDNQLQSRINDILERQGQIEDMFGDMQRLPDEMRNINDEFNTVRTTIEEVRASQDEIRSFLDDILDFENQAGQRIDNH